jgi:hypothetical protein
MSSKNPHDAPQGSTVASQAPRSGAKGYAFRAQTPGVSRDATSAKTRPLRWMTRVKAVGERRGLNFSGCPGLSSGLSLRPLLLEPVAGKDQEREHGRGGEQNKDAHSSVQSPRVVIALQWPGKESGGPGDYSSAPVRKSARSYPGLNGARPAGKVSHFRRIWQRSRRPQ